MRTPLASVSLAAALALSLPAQATLVTTFTSDNGGNAGGAVHFDLTVLNPAGIVLDRLDVNATNPASTRATIELYTTAVGGTYAGNQVNPAAGTWSLRATAAVVTAGTDAPTPALLNKPVVLPPGRYGVALGHIGCDARYTGTATAPPTQTVFANGDLRLDLGTAQNVLFSSATFTPRIANVRLYYRVQAADAADFSADVRSGATPLLVNFTDRSVTPSGPITAWAWDFDDDSVIDSTLQNPLAVYPGCGTFSVRLRVTTAAGSVDTLWPQMIVTEPLRAGFTATPASGQPPLLNVQFSDTSTLAPTAWAWDFDDDGITDSTLQNPTAPFVAGAHRVTLTATRGCHTDTVQQRITVATDQLGTGFASNSFLNRTSVIFFDLAVTAAEELTVCAVDINSYTPAGNPIACSIYLTDGTWNGQQTNPAAWRLAAAGTATTAGPNVATQVFLDRPILLLPGRNYGVAVHYDGAASYYANPGAVAQNNDLVLSPGAAAYSPNGPFTNATLNTPRGWTGTLHYLRRSQWPQGATTWFGDGCAGSLGVPGLQPAAGSRPRLGASLTLQVDRMPQSVGFLLLGLSNTSSPIAPLPFDLTFLGMPGCFARVSPDSLLLLLGSNNAASIALSVPNLAAIAGLRFYDQAMVLSPGSNAQGAVMSDAVASLIGPY